jgi:hypothetical protein
MTSGHRASVLASPMDEPHIFEMIPLKGKVRSMNRPFLYKKPKARTRPGLLDDSESNNDLASWFLDEARGVMIEKFSDSSIEELLIELVSIFREGNPNHAELVGLFGFQEIETKYEEAIRIRTLHNTERTNKDLPKVEISTDPSLIVRQVHLYARELPPVQVLAERIYQAYPDASCEINSDLIIHEKECTIVLSPYEGI